VSTEQNKAVVRRFLDEVFNNKNLAAIEDVIAPDYLFHVGRNTIRGRGGLRQGCAGILAAFPDMQVSMDLMMTEGDLVAGRYTFRGTHLGEFVLPGHRFPPTGTRASMTATTISRIVAGRIAEDWEDQDLFGLLLQLGATIAPPEEDVDRAPHQVR
jgi:predicted ester cyclase